MKKLLKFNIIAMLFSFRLFAETFGSVNFVKSENAFLLTKEQTSSILKEGDFLEEGSQVLVEEGGLVIFSDYFDNSYQLSSGSLVKFFNDGMELFRGIIKVKSVGVDAKKIIIQTPNASVKFSESEGVISFDQYKLRTEVYSFDGLFELISRSNLKSSVNVKKGNFATVTTGIQMGMPSLPHTFSSEQLSKISSIFSESAPRGIASLNQGKIILIRAKKSKPLKLRRRMPASRPEVPIRIFRIPPPEQKKIEVNFLLNDLKSLKN